MKKTIRRTTAGLLTVMTVLSTGALSAISASAATTSPFNVLSTAQQIEKANASTIISTPSGKVNSEAIDKLLKSIKSNKDVKITEAVLKNLIGNKSTGITAQDLQAIALITKTQKLDDSPLFKACKKTFVIPAVGDRTNKSIIYPGNIIELDNQSLLSGIYKSNILIDREKNGEIKVNGTSVTVKDFTSSKLPYSVILKSVNSISTEGGKTFNIRIADASTPTQLSASLGVTTSAINNLIPSETWEKIRTGEKQAAVVAVQQPICEVEYTVDLKHPSNIFSDTTTAGDVNQLINKRTNTANSMLIKKVIYGREYLMLAELNMQCTPLEQKADLKGALTALFNKTNLTTSQKNALNYANVTAMDIGVDKADGKSVSDWRYSRITSGDKLVDVKTPAQFIEYLNSNYEYQKPLCGSTGYLVPLSYEAVSLGAELPAVELSYDTSEYSFKAYKAERINNLSFNDWAKGSNIHGDLVAYGIDIDKFNNTGEIAEKKYSYGRGTHTIPAYQQLFGLEMNLEAGETGSSGNIKITSGGRIYSNALVNITNDNGYNETGRLDLNNAQLDLDKHDPGPFCKYHNKLHTKITLKGDNSYTSRVFDHWSWAADDRKIGYGSAWANLKYVNTQDVDGSGLFLNNIANGGNLK